MNIIFKQSWKFLLKEQYTTWAINASFQGRFGNNFKRNFRLQIEV